MESFEPVNNIPEPPAPASLESAALPESVFGAPPAEDDVDWKQFLLDLVETLVLAVVLYFGINAISARVRVDGFSMVPTLQNGEYVLVSRASYFFGEPQRGDIIVFKFPGPSEQDLIKRIIGLPGDVVEVRAREVYVNGHKIDEPYINAEPQYNGVWDVPLGELFVLGDNRNDSSDSHSWGMLPKENVIGKAIVIYWPPPEWNFINHFDIVLNATPSPISQ